MEDASQALERHHAPAPEPSNVPPEVQADVVGSFYERHYRNWVDSTLPALGGRTPRDAASLKRARPKLIALLKSFENMAERQRRESRPAYDFAWIWEGAGPRAAGVRRRDRDRP